MNVSCPECRSVFRVDPTKIPAIGVRARCSVCGGVIILGAGSSIEEEFGPPATSILSVTAVGPLGSEPELAAPALEFASPRVATPAPAVVTSPVRMPAAQPPSVLPPPLPRRPLTPPRAAPAAVRPAAGPASAPPRPAAFPARAAPAVSTAPSQRPAAGATRPATPARPLAPPMAAAFPARPVSAPARRPAAEPAPPLPPPRPASPTPSRLPINPFLANDPNAKALRLSRALISDLVTYFPQRRDEGLREGTLRELFRDEIKKSYEEYVEQVGREFADSTSHFQDALNEILAGGQKIF